IGRRTLRLRWPTGMLQKFRFARKNEVECRLRIGGEAPHDAANGRRGPPGGISIERDRRATLPAAHAVWSAPHEMRDASIPWPRRRRHRRPDVLRKNAHVPG